MPIASDDDTLIGDTAEDALRGIPPDEIQADSEAIPPPVADAGPTAFTEQVVRYTVTPKHEPQEKDTKYYVTDQATGKTFYAGKVSVYGAYRGISLTSSLLIYDRHQAEQQVGAWAHFMWPTVMAESNGRYISINAWDRAAFTWGFYQLAAHLANHNLILLMRELVKLPSCARYFPDLTLVSGKVAQKTQAGTVSLEREERVEIRPGRFETQIPDFMRYLNPSSRRVDEAEVITAAKFASWAQQDPKMREATIQVSIAIMKAKIKALAPGFGLIGKRPELALWVSDMFHHGRGDRDQVLAALAKPKLADQLEALSEIDTSGKHAARLATVKKHVETLMAENRFNNVKFGQGVLQL